MRELSTYKIPVWAKEFAESVFNKEFKPESMSVDNCIATFKFKELYEGFEEFDSLLTACGIPYESNLPTNEGQGNVTSWVHFDNLSPYHVTRYENKIGYKKQASMIALAKEGRIVELTKILVDLERTSLPHPDFNISTTKPTQWNKFSMAYLNGEIELAEGLLDSPDDLSRAFIKAGGLHELFLINEQNNVSSSLKPLIKLAHKAVNDPGDITLNLSTHFSLGWGTEILYRSLVEMPEFVTLLPELYPEGGRHAFYERLASDLERTEGYIAVDCINTLTLSNHLPESKKHLSRLFDLLKKNHASKSLLDEFQNASNAKNLAEKAKTISVSETPPKRLTL